MEKSFIIDQISWHTQKQRNYVFDAEIIYKYFEAIINYLQDNNLTTRNIVKELMPLNEQTSIASSDLTAEGMELIKKAYGKWVDSVVDGKKAVTNVGLLDKALKKIREN